MNAEGPLVHLREHPELIDADLATIGDALHRGARLLDIGAGRGAFVRAARGRGFEALALDLQLEASAVWPREGVPGVIGDGFKVPFRDGAFDLVRMKEIIEHVEDPLALVLEAKRLLNGGGLVLAHVPTPYSQLYPVGNFWDDYTHVRPLSRVGLMRLFSDAGLQVVRIDGYTAGRNGIERALGKVLARVAPHIYRVIARRDAA
jgi:SAM-dependent methyltransferase